MNSTNHYLLHYCPGAISFCVHWALREAGAAIRLRHVDLAAGEQHSEAYRKENPAGQVPMLGFDGRHYHESTALLMILSDLHPRELHTPALASPERARWLEQMSKFGNGLLPTLGTWLYAEKNVGVIGRDAIRRYAQDRLSADWQQIDERLSRRHYCMGDAFTAVDCLAGMLMFWVRTMPMNAHQWPHLRIYMERIRSRPAFAKVCEVEGLQELLTMPLHT